jgi:hypothetical protein
LGIACRFVWVLCLAWSLTACARFPVGDVSHQAIPSIGRLPILASDARLVVIDSSDRSAVSVSLHAPSTVLTAMSSGAFVESSHLHLSKNGDGSVSVHSDGRPVSLLRGLDPALVNPAVLPFLIPSCEAVLSR